MRFSADGKCKNNASGKMSVFRPFWGQWLAISCQKRSPCFHNFPTFLNFRVRNEMVERGAVSKSQKGKKAFVDRKVGACYQWTTNGQCSKGDSCSFGHEPASGNGREAHKAKGRSSSPAANSKAKTDGEGEIPSKSSGNRGERPSGNVKTMHLEKWPFSDLFGSVVGHIVPKTGSVF